MYDVQKVQKKYVLGWGYHRKLSIMKPVKQ